MSSNHRLWAGKFLCLVFLACDMGVMGCGFCDHLSLGMNPDGMNHLFPHPFTQGLGS